MSPLKADEVANYFLGMVDEAAGDNITPMKLQKLLYYAQGLHVAMSGEPLFEEEIEAWPHGPVVRDVYHGLKVNGSQPILRPESFEVTDYAPEVREFLDAIMEVYGQFTASKLRNMTHEEPPWKDASHRPQDRVIRLEALRDFFSSVVEAGRRGEAIQGEPRWPTESFQFQRRKQLSRRVAPTRDRLRMIARGRPCPDPILDDDED